MNTIPLIFNEKQINRTVIGGRVLPSDAKIDVSIVLINSQGNYRHTKILETLYSSGFASIISIETSPSNSNLEDLARRLPAIKFIIPLEKVTVGDMINIGISEAPSSYVFVIKDTLSISQGMLNSHLADNIISSGKYCIVPRFCDADNNFLPIQFIPDAVKGKFKVSSSYAVSEGMHTLYPFDNIALYNKKKFIQLGGFDYTITSPYYQNLDLALRSWLWGEETILTTSLVVKYNDSVPIEDTTVDFTYLHFYLKNLLPRFRQNFGGMIPYVSFFDFIFHSSCGIFESLREFKDAVNWVSINKSRYYTDIQHLIEMWGSKK